MWDSFPSGTLETAAAIAVGAFALLIRRIMLKTWRISPWALTIAALAGAALPATITLLAYPFLDPRPNLEDKAVFVFIGGVALLSAILLGVWSTSISRSRNEQVTDSGDGRPENSGK